MRHAFLALALALSLPVLAQAPAPEASKPAEKRAERPAAPQPVMEITRSTKPNCDVKPVMTDDEIARCKKAWVRR